MDSIDIQGAKENNLKDINISIPRGKLVCFVGVSGSGKSTIAFDIIAKEGQRQYFESLNAYARRYLPKSNASNVSSISGISPAIIISQERVKNSPRSTVGTLTESYTYLRMLFSRVGLPSMDSSYFSFNHPNGACKGCKGLGRAVAIDSNKVIDWEKSLNEGALLPTDWHVGGRMWNIIRSTRYFDMDKKVKDYGEEELHTLLYHKKELFADDDAYAANRWTYQGVIARLIERNSNPNRSNPQRDLGYYVATECSACNGWRLNAKALSVKLAGKNIGEVANMSIKDCLAFVLSIDHPYARAIKPKLVEQLQSLVNVGVGYVSLNRATETLSGGEAQRVKFARQLGCDLIEMMYVLDEPTAGLHPRDVDMVIQNLRKLQMKGNSVLVVEHDEAVMRGADHIVEIGPGGGNMGGTIVTQGTFDELMADLCSITAQSINKKKIKQNSLRKPLGYMQIRDAHKHNLKHISLQIPTGVLVALTGVSGSGKSSLVEEILVQYAGKVILIDQTSVGNNKRGCIGTYSGAFDIIRGIFAKEHQMSESFFSFNARGACDECKGLGIIDRDMNFLGNISIPCEKCNGSRYLEKVLRYTYKGKNIAEVLKMSAIETKEFFDNEEIRSKMQLLIDVGLDYLEIGQTLDTLSGGESQRLKLASKLQSRGEVYILDEPTTGLHMADIEKLMKLLDSLVDNGNSVLVVEHNLDVISQADWIIDLGPEGGDEGGQIVAEGTPDQIKQVAHSFTGQYLREFTRSLCTHKDAVAVRD